MEEGKDFASLPREMALKIFDLLSIEELKICVQVDTLSACKGLRLKVCVTGVSSLVGHWKQPITLEEPYVLLSLLSNNQHFIL